MKLLPSLEFLRSQSASSFKRFSLTIISAFIMVFFAVFLIENGEKTENYFPMVNIMLCSGLGIPLFFIGAILNEKWKFAGKKKYLIDACILISIILVFLSLPASKSGFLSFRVYINYAIYVVAAHLIVSISPFLLSNKLNAFWHYNKVLFIRFLHSILYSGFIWIGLMIALAALRLLFDIKIHEPLYFEIGIACFVFFNTWFFCAGIPLEFDEMEQNVNYPGALKIFTQYVLLPLLFLYLLILYSYGTKIMLSWMWPKGIVSYLIICVGVLGIFTSLLLHPYGNLPGNSWITKASRSYYFLLIPLIVILFFAILMRLDDYGITIKRYLVLTLGVWLSIVCLFTIFSKKANIKFIPTNLVLVLLLISFGPWGMFSVSEHSQVKRLKFILENNGLLEKEHLVGEIHWVKDSLPHLIETDVTSKKNTLKDSLQLEVKSILDYLDDYHNFDLIKGWFKQDLESISKKIRDSKSNYHISESELYMRTMGLNYEIYEVGDAVQYFSYTSEFDKSILNITGNDYLVSFEYYFEDETNPTICKFKLDSVHHELKCDFKNNLRLSIITKTENLILPFDSLLNKLRANFTASEYSSLPNSYFTLQAENKNFSYLINFYDIGLEQSDKELIFSRLSGVIFVRKK